MNKLGDAGGSQIQQLSDDVEALLFTRSRYIKARMDDTFRGGAVVGKKQQWVVTFGNKYSCLMWNRTHGQNILETEKPLRELSHPSPVSCYTTVDDLLILGYRDRSIKVWNLHSGANLQTYELDQPILVLAYQDRQLWVACEKKVVVLEL